MTQTNGISIDLSTYRKFCRIMMMIKLTGVVNLQDLRGDREREETGGNKVNEDFTSAGAAE